MILVQTPARADGDAGHSAASWFFNHSSASSKDHPKCQTPPKGKIPPAVKALLGKGNCPSGEYDSTALYSGSVTSEQAQSRRNRVEFKDDSYPPIATRIVHRAAAKPPMATSIQLGDGWGCARLHDASQHCWQVSTVAAKRGGTIRAQHIPWLDDHWIGVGPDRLCQEEDKGYRCWRAPEFIQLPQTWKIPSNYEGDSARTWRVENNEHVWENDFTPVTHGAWRGCSSEWCWNPKNPPTPLKMCQSKWFSIPCVIADQSAVNEFADGSSTGSPIVGDLFACVRWAHGLQCIGASRDGLFGTTEECPVELLQAWPTSAGPVAAPNAKCARRPVRVGASDYPGNEASASPRGLCIEDAMRSERAQFDCFGAIPVLDKSMYPVVVGLGNEPSACGINELGQVYCWGAGYTLATSNVTAVRIEFDIPKSGSIVAWQGNGPFKSTCAINRNCARSAAALPVCPKDRTGMSVSAALDHAITLEGQRVTIRGALGLPRVVSNDIAINCCPDEPGRSTTCTLEQANRSGDYCCLDAEGPVAIVGDVDYLPLEGLKCGGDLSRMCCNLPVLGQTVLTSGTLTWRTAAFGIGSAWVLADPSICEASSTKY